MYKFSWTEKMVGISLGVIGLLVGLVQGGLVRWLNPKIGSERSIYYGLFFYAVGMILFAFATQEWMMFVFLVPYCLGGIAGPALQSVIAGAVPKTEQGELQGALTSLISATAIVGPPLMTNLFFFFTHDQAPFQFSGAPFFVAFLLFSASIFFVHKAFTKNKI